MDVPKILVPLLGMCDGASLAKSLERLNRTIIGGCKIGCASNTSLQVSCMPDVFTDEYLSAVLQVDVVVLFTHCTPPCLLIQSVANISSLFSNSTNSPQKKQRKVWILELQLKDCQCLPDPFPNEEYSRALSSHVAQFCKSRESWLSHHPTPCPATIKDVEYQISVFLKILEAWKKFQPRVTISGSLFQ